MGLSQVSPRRGEGAQSRPLGAKSSVDRVARLDEHRGSRSKRSTDAPRESNVVVARRSGPHRLSKRLSFPQNTSRRLHSRHCDDGTVCGKIHYQLLRSHRYENKMNGRNAVSKLVNNCASSKRGLLDITPIDIAAIVFLLVVLLNAS